MDRGLEASIRGYVGHRLAVHVDPWGERRVGVHRALAAMRASVRSGPVEHRGWRVGAAVVAIRISDALLVAAPGDRPQELAILGNDPPALQGAQPEARRGFSYRWNGRGLLGLAGGGFVLRAGGRGRIVLARRGPKPGLAPGAGQERQ